VRSPRSASAVPLVPMLSLVSTLWLAAAVTACAAPGPPPLPPEEAARARAEYENVRQLLAVDAATGTEELERFLRTWPRSELADDAALELARRAFEAGSLDRAARHLVWATRLHPRGDRVDEVHLLLARVERERGHAEAAYRTASRVRLSRLAPAQRHRMHLLLADLAAERGDHGLALRWLSQAHAEAPEPEARAGAVDRIDALLTGLSRRELEAAARELGGRFPAARVHLRLAGLALEAGEADAARRHLQEVAALEVTPAEALRRDALMERLAGVAPPGESAAALPDFHEVAPEALRPDAVRGTLGVVLPLSGPFAGFGEECLRGVLLAAGSFGPASGNGSGPGVRVLVQDTQGTAEGAAAAVRRLAHESDASAIVGPLLASEAEAAAAAAEIARVPLLALTGRDAVARGRPHVFRMGRAVRGEIEVLVAHAVESAGLGRFAILYPEDAYGRGTRDLFWDQVEARGGRVVGVQSYDPDATDFADPIRDLIGYRLLTSREKEALEEREDMLDQAKRLPPEEALVLREEARAMLGPEGEPLPPIVDFDALFIPDSYEKVTLIAPQLAFHDAEGARLLGAAGWNHPDLVRIGGEHLEGAIFTETFFPASDVPYVADFTRSFAETYGAPPGSLAALAFDAARLVLAQLARGVDRRSEVRQALLDVRAWPGVSGVTTMRSDGTAQKRPYLLGVQSRSIQALERNLP